MIWKKIEDEKEELIENIELDLQKLEKEIWNAIEKRTAR